MDEPSGHEPSPEHLADLGNMRERVHQAAPVDVAACLPQLKALPSPVARGRANHGSAPSKPSAGSHRTTGNALILANLASDRKTVRVGKKGLDSSSLFSLRSTMPCVPLMALGGLLAFLAASPTHAAAPMSAFFRTSAPHLVHAHAYYHSNRLEASCGIHAPLLGACAGRNGTVVWRSLPPALHPASTARQSA